MAVWWPASDLLERKFASSRSVFLTCLVNDMKSSWLSVETLRSLPLAPQHIVNRFEVFCPVLF